MAQHVSYRTIKADGLSIFYLAHGADPREVGAGLEVLPIAPNHHARRPGSYPSASSAASMPSISAPL